MRRAAAGELAALLGPALSIPISACAFMAFAMSRSRSWHRCPAADRAILDAYVRGVNAGLEHATARGPGNISCCARKPQPWLAEDSLLAAFSMYLNLNDSTGEEELRARSCRRVCRRRCSRSCIRSERNGMRRSPAACGARRRSLRPEVFDLRQGASTGRGAVDARVGTACEERDIVGSNSWAVAGDACSRRARPARQRYASWIAPAERVVSRAPDRQRAEPRRRVISSASRCPACRCSLWAAMVTSPGDSRTATAIGRISSSSKSDPANPGNVFRRRRTRSRFATRRETIAVRGGAPSVDRCASRRAGVRSSKHDAQGRPLALAWTAHHPRATNVRMLDFESASDCAGSLARCGESSGRAGAELSRGRCIRAHRLVTHGTRAGSRATTTRRCPHRGAHPGTGWIGWRDARGISARHRSRRGSSVDGQYAHDRCADLARLSWATAAMISGARAAQIRDDLLALPAATVARPRENPNRRSRAVSDALARFAARSARRARRWPIIRRVRRRAS